MSYPTTAALVQMLAQPEPRNSMSSAILLRGQKRAALSTPRRPKATDLGTLATPTHAGAGEAWYALHRVSWTVSKRLILPADAMWNEILLRALRIGDRLQLPTPCRSTGVFLGAGVHSAVSACAA